jgi:hypothetical protein
MREEIKENRVVLKKQKVGKLMEEKQLEKLKGVGEKKEQEEELGIVRLVRKDFCFSSGDFYFFNYFLQFWPPNLNAKKFEHMMLL